MSAALDYGVQSFCFRNFKDNADVAGKVKEIGLMIYIMLQTPFR